MNGGGSSYRQLNSSSACSSSSMMFFLRRSHRHSLLRQNIGAKYDANPFGTKVFLSPSPLRSVPWSCTAPPWRTTRTRCPAPGRGTRGSPGVGPGPNRRATLPASPCTARRRRSPSCCTSAGWSRKARGGGREAVPALCFECVQIRRFLQDTLFSAGAGKRREAVCMLI